MAELIWNEEEIQHIDSLKELGLQKLTLDINRRIEPKFAKENDTKSRGLDIQVKKDNKVIDTTGVVLKMYAMPVKEQEVYEIESTVIDASRGKYEIVYPTVILQAGITLAEIVLTKDEQVISSKKFKIEVESRLLTDDVVKGHDAYPLFEQLLEAAKTIEGVDIAAEEEREKNEIIRQTQEQQRQESMTDIEHRFNLLETSKQQDAEVINARTSTVKGKTFNSLNDRLEETEKEIDKPLYSTPVETYDNVISLPDNTTNGQVSVNIFGNTETDEEGNTKSTIAAMQIKSVGKNLINNNNNTLFNSIGTGVNNVWIDGKLKVITGIMDAYGKGLKLNVLPNKKYTICSKAENSNDENTPRIYIGYSPKTGELANPYIPTIDQPLSFIPTQDTIYIRFAKDRMTDANNPVYFWDIQLEEGDTATEYEPYKESTAYVVAKDKDNKIVNLKSLPNGTADKINLNKGELIKSVSDEVTLSGDKVYYLDTNEADFDYVRLDISNLTNIVKGLGSVRVDSLTQIPTHSDRNLNTFFIRPDGNINVYFEKNKFTDLRSAKDFFNINPVTLTYQLVEPEHIPIEIEGELQGYENGTVYFTPYIKDRFIVDGTKTIALQYPIKAIDKLLKLDTANAAWIEVEGVLSEDGQTITVTEEGTYKVYGEIQEGYSTEGLKRIVTNINLNAQINSNTTAIEKINNKIYTDADLFTAILLQQEVRITALEQGGVI